MFLPLLSSSVIFCPLPCVLSPVLPSTIPSSSLSSLTGVSAHASPDFSDVGVGGRDRDGLDVHDHDSQSDLFDVDCITDMTGWRGHAADRHRSECGRKVSRQESQLTARGGSSAEKAMLRSQNGSEAGLARSAFAWPPSPPPFSLSHLSMWPFSRCVWPPSRSVRQGGCVGRRGFALESAAARVCREGCARVFTHVMVRDLELTAPHVPDGRLLEVIAERHVRWSTVGLGHHIGFGLAL